MLQKLVEQGINPPALDRKPELTFRQAWLAGEFQRLSRDRRYTDNGPLPLDTGSIRTYYLAFQLHDFEFDDFYMWMTSIDDMWLSEVTAKREKEQAAAQNKAKSSPRRTAKR